MNRATEGGWGFLNYLDPPRLGFTWSGGSGCNLVSCAVRKRGVCWAMRIVPRLGRFCPLCPTFEPHLHNGENGTPNRLDQPLQRRIPSVITPISTGDLFGFPYDMQQKILDIIEKAKWHIFPTLTKAPNKAWPFMFPDNLWFGVTVNEQDDTWRLDVVKEKIYSKIWAIFEPLYGPIDYDLSFLDWIIIGHQSRPTLQPEEEWVQSIIDNAKGTPIFMKSSLKWSPLRRESPIIQRLATKEDAE